MASCCHSRTAVHRISLSRLLCIMLVLPALLIVWSLAFSSISGRPCPVASPLFGQESDDPDIDEENDGEDYGDIEEEQDGELDDDVSREEETLRAIDNGIEWLLAQIEVPSGCSMLTRHDTQEGRGEHRAHLPTL